MSKRKIDEIAKQIDPVEIISRYTKVKQNGSSYKAVCPFHHDNDPSLSIEPKKGLWHCFGCQKGGDIFDFVSEIENIPFIEAARQLGNEVGIDLETSNSENDFEQKLHNTLHEVAQRFHHNLLNSSQADTARDYLVSRGYTDKDLDQFLIGYALPGWNNVTDKLVEKYDKETAIQSGLSKHNGEQNRLYDRFRDRIIFPVRSNHDKVVAFGGRRVKEDEDVPKYINSPHTPIYTKGKHLYGLNVARKNLNGDNTLILVEGYTDVTASYKAGVQNVVASLGTSFTDEQADLLAKYANEVIIAYDQDKAGQEATIKGGKKLQNRTVTVTVAGLEEGQDPGDLVESGDIDLYRNILEDAQPFYQFFLKLLRQYFDFSNETETRKALKKSRNFLKTLDNALVRQKIIDELVNLFDISESELRRSLSGDAFLLNNTSHATPNTDSLQFDDWVLYLCVHNHLSTKRLIDENLVYGLDKPYRQIIEKLHANGSDLQSAAQDLEQEHKTILAKVEFLSVPDQVDLDSIKKDIINRLELTYQGKKVMRIKKELQEENGASDKDILQRALKI